MPSTDLSVVSYKRKRDEIMEKRWMKRWRCMRELSTGCSYVAIFNSI